MRAPAGSLVVQRTEGWPAKPVGLVATGCSITTESRVRALTARELGGGSGAGGLAVLGETVRQPVRPVRCAAWSLEPTSVGVP
jgi:hypothetical protein